MKTVAVLMSTYNGSKYLKVQIDCVLNQIGVKIIFFVRDDASKDETQAILESYARQGKLFWFTGNNLGPSKSFMDLIFSAPIADYYALCDQDDFWENNKLYKAVQILENMDDSKPLLYCSATQMVDASLNPLNVFNKVPGVTSFNQAIICTNATGCTMCFNRKTIELIRLHRPVVDLMHDAWIHKLCLAVKGCVYYDPHSYIKYRQHGNNVVGGNSTFLKRWKRRWKNFRTLSKVRSKAVTEILMNYEGHMPQENVKMANIVAQYDSSIICRLRLALGRQISFPDKKIDFIYRIAVLLGVF